VADAADGKTTPASEMSDCSQLGDPSQSNCTCSAVQDIHPVPVVGQGAGASHRWFFHHHRTRWGGVWLSDLPSSLAAIRRAAQLPAKAIGLGHLSPGLVARHYPGVPPMQVDCQLLTRAFSG
jgi:hypothetical protein